MADELGLPKSSLQKAIKELLPGDMRLAGDAGDLLVQCCNQFVHLLSTQARPAGLLLQSLEHACCPVAACHATSSALARAHACACVSSPSTTPPPLSPPPKQANDISERDKRTTISPEHILKALEELEFGAAYSDPVRAGAPRACLGV